MALLSSILFSPEVQGFVSCVQESPGDFQCNFVSFPIIQAEFWERKVICAKQTPVTQTIIYIVSPPVSQLHPTSQFHLAKIFTFSDWQFKFYPALCVLVYL